MSSSEAVSSTRRTSCRSARTWPRSSSVGPPLRSRALGRRPCWSRKAARAGPARRLDQRIRVSGGEVAAGVFGQGPPVVVVHGTPASSYLWRKVVPLLSHEHTVHVWDLLGFGDSRLAAGVEPSIARQARTLAELTDHWGLDAPSLVGHDIGGGVVTRAARTHSSVTAGSRMKLCRRAGHGTAHPGRLADVDEGPDALGTAVHVGLEPALVARVEASVEVVVQGRASGSAARSGGVPGFRSSWFNRRRRHANLPPVRTCPVSPRLPVFSSLMRIH